MNAGTAGTAAADRVPPARRLAALALTIALGLASRLGRTGFPPIDKSLGDVLYAVAAYLALALARPRAATPALLAASVALCWAIEAFQATGIPARHADLAWVRWLVGTTFSWHDVACYPVGGALAALADVRLLRPAAPTAKLGG